MGRYGRSRKKALQHNELQEAGPGLEGGLWLGHSLGVRKWVRRSQMEQIMHPCGFTSP
jgi:hypothetical protein